jgi:hypothetical protein
MRLIEAEAMGPRPWVPPCGMDSGDPHPSVFVEVPTGGWDFERGHTVRSWVLTTS